MDIGRVASAVTVIAPANAKIKESAPVCAQQLSCSYITVGKGMLVIIDRICETYNSLNIMIELEAVLLRANHSSLFILDFVFMG